MIIYAAANWEATESNISYFLRSNDFIPYTHIRKYGPEKDISHHELTEQSYINT